jgi:hypothetical protein
MEALTVIAIILGPIVAVGITLWWQRRKEKRDRQLQLFTTFMANRRAALPSYEWANALNLIDVVFADHPKIVDLWHECYLLFQNQAQTQALGHRYLELLSEMARVLKNTERFLVVKKDD